MDKELLRKHIKDSIAKRKANPAAFADEQKERDERLAYYSAWTADRLKRMSPDEFLAYLSKLWAMRSWGNKQYVVDKMLADNPRLMESIADCLWGSASLAQRWDKFRSSVKGLGPAMISELLCYTHPKRCVIWNRRAYGALSYLGEKDVPWHYYQLTGEKYEGLCKIAYEIAEAMRKEGMENVDMLSVNFFFWEELQRDGRLCDIRKEMATEEAQVDKAEIKRDKAGFIHNEIRDAIADIGGRLGFIASTEKRVAEGAIVDAVWEVTIGNMGRVIYVFEVQTKGSLDSLMVNLQRALNNPAVQGVVAVSDVAQIEKLKKEVATVPGLKDKLKYWNYLEVLDVQKSLEQVNESINALGLVPQGF